MKGVYISDLVISKKKVGNTWGDTVSKPVWDTGAWHEIAGGLSNIGAHTWDVPALPSPQHDARLRMITDDTLVHSVTGTTVTFHIVLEPDLITPSALLFVAAARRHDAWRRGARQMPRPRV